MKAKLVIGAVFAMLAFGVTAFAGMTVGMTLAGGQAEREVWQAAVECEQTQPNEWRDCFLNRGANAEIESSVREGIGG